MVYMGLLVLALWKGPSPVFFAGIFFVFGSHLFLVLRMIEGVWCLACVAAAVNAMFLAALTVALDRAHLKIAACAIPCSAIILLLVPRPLSAARMIQREQPQEGLRLIVLERNQCVYCRELRETITPRLQSEFGDRVTIVYHSADDFPGVTKTPTLILMRNQEAQVFEGLPPYEMLRKAVRAKLEGSP
jgi:hypothetical protein